MITVLTLVLVVGCAAAVLYGLFLLVMRRGQRKRGAMLALCAWIVFGFGVFGLMWADAINQGWAGLGEKSRAAEIGITDAAEFAAHEKRQADKIAAELAEAEKEQKKLGHHCLSAWDGSSRELVAALKAMLRDPDSFEHIATKTLPVDAAGKNAVFMEYRARNGFGGMNVETATGEIDNATCAALLLATE